MKHMWKKQGYLIFISVVLLSISTKFLSLYKDRLVAYNFGLSNELDGFYFALVFIAFPSAIYMNAVQTAIVPLSISYNKDGKIPLLVYRQIIARSVRDHSSLIVIWIVFSVLVVFMFNVELDRAKFLAYWSLLNLPHVFLSGIVLVQHGVLQAMGYAKTVSLLPGLVSLFTVLFLLLSNSKTVELLALGHSVAVGVEFLICKWILNESKSGDVNEADLKEFWKEVRTLSVMFIFLASVHVVDKMIALSLNVGDLTSVNFGSKIPLTVNGLILTGINVALFPVFSKGALEHSLNEMKRLYFQVAGILGLFLFLVAILGAIFSAEIVQIVFSGGSFGDGEISRVSAVQTWYFFTLPLAAIFTSGIKFLVGINKSSRVSNLTKITVPVNIVASLTCAHFLGAEGIAIGSVIALLFSCVLMVFSVIGVTDS